jgi:hypothetical protein
LVRPFEPASVLLIVAVTVGWVVMVLFAEAAPERVTVPLLSV